MNPEARELILRSTHLSRCPRASRTVSICNCLPVARAELIKHTLAGLTLDAELRDQLLDEIGKFQPKDRGHIQ